MSWLLPVSWDVQQPGGEAGGVVLVREPGRQGGAALGGELGADQPVAARPAVGLQRPQHRTAQRAAPRLGEAGQQPFQHLGQQRVSR